MQDNTTSTVKTAKKFETKAKVIVPKNTRNSIYLVVSILNENGEIISEMRNKMSSSRWAEIQQTEAGAKLKGEDEVVEKNGKFIGFTIYTLYP